MPITKIKGDPLVQELSWLRTNIVACHGNPLVLWQKLLADKALATVAMRVLLDTASLSLAAPPTMVGKVIAIKPPTAQRANRTVRRALLQRQTQERDVIAASIVQRATAAIVKRALETFVLLDGRRLQDVKWYELPNLARESNRQAQIVERILRTASVTDPNARVRDIVSADRFDQILAAIA